MYHVSVESVFSAAHAISIAGEREELHGHDWRVTVTITAPELDADGLVCDFHAVEAALAEVTRPFANRTINGVPPFNATNPTAERIAQHIGTSLRDSLSAVLPDGAWVASVRITEAPGCAATWIADQR